jgi:HEAT repeat protein
MLRALDSPLVDVRARALAGAEGMPGQAVTAAWLRELPERPEEVQAEIIAMLGRRGDETALPALRGALQSPSRVVRTAAISAASRIGGTAVLEDLWPLLGSEEPDEIAAVQQALLRLPSERVVPGAIARLDHAGPLAQAALLELLAERRAQDAAGRAFSLLSSGEPAVRKAALTALKDLVSGEDIGRLIELLIETETRREIPAIQDALVAGAGQISAPEERAASVLAAYGETPEARRPDLLRPMARIGGEAALNLVIQETRHANPRIRAAAVYALSQWPEPDAAGELIRICREAPDRKYLYTALQGYVRLVGEAEMPADQKTAMLEDAMDLELGTQEKNLILAGLARIKSLAALELAARFLDDPEVRSRAARIVLRIALPEAGAEGLADEDIIPILKRARPFIEDEQGQEQIDSRIDQLMRREGFVPLFNGKNLDGWMGDTEGYAAEDGVIVIHPDRGSGNLYTVEQYADFILRFEFRLTSGANNGLGIRTPPEGDAAYVGMELQILDNSAPKYRDLKPYQYHGSIYGVVPAKRGYQRRVGEWNTQEVRAIGPRITVILNGEVIVDADIHEASASGTLDGRQHPGLLREKGHIGFLGHGSRVEFRNLWIKTVEPKG